MSVIALAAEAGWNNAGDDISLVGAIRAVREVKPGASLTVITPNADRVGAFVGEGVTCVESPLRSIEEVAGRSRGLLGKRQTARSAERMLEAALSGGPDVPEPVRETVSALADADLLVFAGGGYLDDRRPVAARTASFLGRAARRRGLPYVVFGNAVGPFEESGPRGDAKDLLAGAAAVGVRESRSAWEASSLMRGRAPEVIGDPAVQLPPEEEPTGPTFLVNFRLVRPADAGLIEMMGDAVTMIAGRIKAGVTFIEASIPPAFDDRTALASLEPRVLASVPRGKPATLTPGRLDLPPAALTMAVSSHVCLRSLARGTPTIGVATAGASRHKLRGLFELFERPEWVWTPEAGVHDLIERATTAAADSRAERLREIADDLRARQRTFLERLLERSGPAG